MKTSIEINQSNTRNKYKVTVRRSSMRMEDSGLKLLPPTSNLQPSTKYIDSVLFPLTNKSGVALLIVLLIITLISVLIFEFNYGTRVDLIKTKNRANLLKAFYIAKSGINGAVVVLNEDSKDYDGLDENWAQEIPGIPFGDGNLFVKVTDEGGQV